MLTLVDPDQIETPSLWDECSESHEARLTKPGWTWVFWVYTASLPETPME